jgi:hypothetical protein
MAILDQRMDLAGDEVDAGRLTVPWRLYSCSRAKVIEFLKLLHAAYPTHTAIKLILDNHSAHASNAPVAEGPMAALDDRPRPGCIARRHAAMTPSTQLHLEHTRSI